MTPFPFVSALDTEDVREFHSDLLSSLMQASSMGTLDPYIGTLRAWKSTVEIMSNPEVFAKMTAEFSHDDLVELQPPIEAETAETVV